mgnify:CR=1 FL=1
MIHHITQGRMNPVHAGHELVVNQVRNAANKNGHTIILTGSHDPKKNPLTPEQKLKHLLLILIDVPIEWKYFQTHVKN